MGYFFPVPFILFAIFIIWLNFKRKKSERDDINKHNAFWERENDANNVRRQSLDNLKYIVIPNDILLPNLISDEVLLNDPELIRCSDILTSLQTERIFNLTGMTSTDIKMTYGPANLSTLDEYDQNFTLFAQTIYAYGDRLCNLNKEHEAMKVLRFGIDSLSDISGNYKLLATLYTKYKYPNDLEYLKETAGRLNSLSKNSILKYLAELKDNNDTNDVNDNSPNDNDSDDIDANISIDTNINNDDTKTNYQIYENATNE